MSSGFTQNIYKKKSYTTILKKSRNPVNAKWRKMVHDCGVSIISGCDNGKEYEKRMKTSKYFLKGMGSYFVFNGKHSELIKEFYKAFGHHPFFTSYIRAFDGSAFSPDELVFHTPEYCQDSAAFWIGHDFIDELSLNDDIRAIEDEWKIDTNVLMWSVFDFELKLFLKYCNKFQVTVRYCVTEDKSIYDADIERSRFLLASCETSKRNAIMESISSDVRNLRNFRPSIHKDWAKAVKSRDEVCINCGEEDGLHAHHIKSYQDYPELRFDIDNGVALCEKCHVDLHAGKIKLNISRD